jgi:hypothetical protein
MSTPRERCLALLTKLGFQVADSLPTQRHDGPPAMRPLGEVAARLYAMASVFLWVTDWGDEITDAELQKFIAENGLESVLSESELAILALDRTSAREEHGFNIGWRLENMWALAWVLGFEPSPALEGMIDHDTISAMLGSLEIPRRTPAGFLAQAKPRTLEKVDVMEDLFYCAHNAVRSAQMGEETVPEDFDPMADGGGIHERRHALTWVMSPGIAWDDTDLST